MLYLALDLGNRTGWSIFNNKKVLKSDSVLLKTVKNKKEMLTFSNFLEEKFETYAFNKVFYEEVPFAKFSSGKGKWSMYNGVLMYFVQKHGLPIKGYSPTHVKKVFTGNYMAKKLDMYEAAKLKGYKLSSPIKKLDDEVDAIAVAECALLEGDLIFNKPFNKPILHIVS